MSDNTETNGTTSPAKCRTMMVKTETHKAIKDHCDSKGLKISFWIENALRKALEQ